MVEPIADPTDAELARWHRTMGPLLFNRTWELLDLETRNSEQEEEMLSAALGQRYHWYQVGHAKHKAISDWQVSRVLAVLGQPELSVRFGFLSLELCEQNGLEPFYTGYAHEAIARAADLVADTELRDRHIAAASALAVQVPDPDERGMLEADVALIC